MPVFKVGEPYNPNVRTWPEAIQYNYRGGGHELLLLLRSPSPAELAAVRLGKVSLALYTEGPLLVLLYQLGAAPKHSDGIPWSDAPYSWHRVPDGERDLPSADLEANKRALLQIFLVDAGNGILKAMRQVSLSPEFTRALHKAIRAQAAQPWDQTAYDRTLDRLFARYQSTAELLKVAQHRTEGGA